MIQKKNTSDSLVLKLKVLANEKEGVRRKLVKTAKKLAVTARQKEGVRRKLVKTAKQLAVTARQKELARVRLAVLAKEKENVRRKLVVTADKLKLKAEQLVITAAEKEEIRLKLAVTAEELRLKAKQLVATAREKKEREDISRKLEITAEKLKFKAAQFVVAAKEKEDIQHKLIEHTKDLEHTRYAILNILEDLRLEKESLAKSKVKDEAVLESIGDGVVATDKNGRIILMNNAAEALLGYKSKELLGKMLVDVVRIEDAKGNRVSTEERPIRFALGAKKSVDLTSVAYFYLRKDGTKLPVALTVAPIILNKEIIGAVDVFRDITKEREIDEAKTAFVSIASHQLRTPLTGIHWLTELLEREKLTGKGREYLEDIKTSVKRLNSLVELLLNISRLEEGKIEISPQAVDVVRFIKKIVDSLAIIYNKKRLSFSFVADEPKLVAMTDVGALQNITQAILPNAIEYTPEGGKIEVRLKRHGRSILLTVRDTGIGIPQKDMDRIFQKFARAGNAERFKAGGMGMGLWIAEQATKLLGGKIWFESRENKGTTFFVEIPLKSKSIKGTKKLV